MRRGAKASSTPLAVGESNPPPGSVLPPYVPGALGSPLLAGGMEWCPPILLCSSHYTESLLASSGRLSPAPGGGPDRLVDAPGNSDQRPSVILRLSSGDPGFIFYPLVLCCLWMGVLSCSLGSSSLPPSPILPDGGLGPLPQACDCGLAADKPPGPGSPSSVAQALPCLSPNSQMACSTWQAG